MKPSSVQRRKLLSEAVVPNLNLDPQPLSLDSIRSFIFDAVGDKFGLDQKAITSVLSKITAQQAAPPPPPKSSSPYKRADLYKGSEQAKKLPPPAKMPNFDQDEDQDDMTQAPAQDDPIQATPTV